MTTYDNPRSDRPTAGIGREPPSPPPPDPILTGGAGLALRMVARLRSASLDARLAAGSSPGSDLLLRARADQLGQEDTRRRLADGWGQVLAIAQGGRRRRSAQVAPVANRVVAALPAIDQLVARLRDPETPIDVVAGASRLLSDGTGPVYNRQSPVDLRVALGALVSGPPPGMGR